MLVHVFKIRIRDMNASNVVNRDIEALLKDHFHGAVNIRGIRYQILYSLLRAFDLYDETKSINTIVLEGVEDIDLSGDVVLNGFHSSNEYVQVKTSGQPWTWGMLKNPLKGFLDIYRIKSQDVSFLLAVDFPLIKDILSLSQIDSLSEEDKDKIQAKFYALCIQVGATKSEAEGLLKLLKIISYPEGLVWEDLRRRLVDVFTLGSEAINIYILVFIAKFFEWARDRKSIKRSDLEELRATIAENLAREATFQAFGDSLIQKISWEKDKNPLDFFEGKGTRIGHIAADIDVRRPIWIERIEKAINSSKICILRAPSGQGKSTLLYRYAYEKGPEENTFILKVARLPEHVAHIIEYLQFRAKLGRPMLLLIDNAGWQTQLWPSIAQECAALGIPVLISARVEDYSRFAKESLTNWEVIEPDLNLDEAEKIFNSFSDVGKIHPNIASPEWAYERIGNPPLLMEYVCLITQGKMLEDLLKDQIKQFSEQGEDPVKVEILRRVALADTLGTSVRAEILLRDLKFKDDPSKLLRSLSGEYLNLDNGLLSGLHWVRSEHIARILHSGYPDPTNTAIVLLDSVPRDSLRIFVSNALCMNGLKADKFMDGLIKVAKNAEIAFMLSLLDGIFEAGERKFFEANRKLFDEAYDLFGLSGLIFLSSDFMPVLKLDIINQMINMASSASENFLKLKEMTSRVGKTAEGMDLCREFLKNISSSTTPENLKTDLNDIGFLLDWCSLCKVELHNWPMVQNDILTDKRIFDYPINSFSIFMQGLYRYCEKDYMDWIHKNQDCAYSYLKLKTNCLELRVEDNNLYIEYFIDFELGKPININEQSVSRLRELRSALPFCKLYESHGIYLLPSGLKPSIDESHKKIAQQNLPFKSDVQKNALWPRIVQIPYLPDSYYEYEKSWFQLRQDALRFVRLYSEIFVKIFKGKKINKNLILQKNDISICLEKSLRMAPFISEIGIEQILIDVRKNFSQPLSDALTENAMAEWSSNFQNFFVQISSLLENRDLRSGQLAMHYLYNAIKYLPMMQNAFSSLFKNAPDYFGLGKLSQEEISEYKKFADLLELWIFDPPKKNQRDIIRYIRIRKEEKHKDRKKRIAAAFEPLRKNGIIAIMPSDLYIDNPLKYLPVAINVESPIHPEYALLSSIQAISRLLDMADWFCIIPIHNGTRFLEGGYLISPEVISEIEKGQISHWEDVAIREIPEGVFNLLPSLPEKPQLRLQIIQIVDIIIETLEPLNQLKTKIESLKSSANEFEIELSVRNENMIREFIRSLGSTASGINDQLSIELSGLSEDKNYKKVQSFLTEVENASLVGDFRDLYSTYHSSFSSIRAALEQLLMNGYHS
jgi:hypothetical protein